MSSRIRLLHGCPSFGHLNCICGGKTLCQNVNFGVCSNYHDIDYGGCNLSLCLPQQIQKPVASAYTFIPEGSFHTAVFSGQRDDTSMFIVPDGFSQMSADKAWLRFVNLAADAPCLDFRFSDGAFIIANNIRYKEVTRYYAVTPSTYQMQAMLCDTQVVVLQVPSVTLSAGRSYTIYITGSARVHPYCSHILTIDGCADRPMTLPSFPHLHQHDFPSCGCNDYYPNWDCGCTTSCWNCVCTPVKQSAPTIWEPCSCNQHDHYYHDDCNSCHDWWNTPCDNHWSHGDPWHTSNGISYGSSYYHSYNDHC